MKSAQEQIIIQRKGKRGGHKGGGGAWKVAFADFTLAMMAFFMVLWIMAISSQQERQLMASKLRDYSIMSNEANPFDIRNSPYPINLEGKPSVEDQAALQYMTDTQPKAPNDMFHQANGKKLSKSLEGSQMHGFLDTQEQMQKLGTIVSKLAREAGLQNNLHIEVVSEGLRIQIRDDDNKQMYARGSAFVTPYFHQLLDGLTPILAQIDNRMMISGHTDSAPYPGDTYTNWELSSERANMARRIMAEDGLPKTHIARVMGLADTMLLLPKEPLASANRRIEILLMNRKAEQMLRNLFAQPDHAVPVNQLQKPVSATPPAPLMSYQSRPYIHP